MADPTLAGPILHDLDDHAFVIVRGGGATDSQGRTAPRHNRLGAHHNPSARKLAMSRKAGGPGVQSEDATGDPGQDKNKGTLNRQAVGRVVAAINSGTLDGVRLTAADRNKAWNHMQQHATELGMPLPPKRF